MSCYYRVTPYGLLLEPVHSTGSHNHHKSLTILATSARSSQQQRAQERILAHKAVDGPLCQYRKGFFDHLKPRAFIMGVSPTIEEHLKGLRVHILNHCSFFQGYASGDSAGNTHHGKLYDGTTRK